VATTLAPLEGHLTSAVVKRDDNRRLSCISRGFGILNIAICEVDSSAQSVYVYGKNGGLLVCPKMEDWDLRSLCAVAGGGKKAGRMRGKHQLVMVFFFLFSFLFSFFFFFLQIGKEEKKTFQAEESEEEEEEEEEG